MNVVRFLSISSASARAAGRNLVSRAPNNVTIVEAKEFALAIGATWKTQFPEGVVTLQKNGHIHQLHAGRKQAEYDGQSVTLRFPVMRTGADTVACSLVVLQRLEQP